MSGSDATGAPEPTEEELRAVYEEQLRRLTPADLIVQTVVSLVNLAARRLGLEPGEEDDRDLAQARDAIDGARALLPILERSEPADMLSRLRDALSALQLQYARLAGPASGDAPPPPAADPRAAPEPETDPGADGAGPAQRSGRLWVPGS